jgi:hypothetical protein
VEGRRGCGTNYNNTKLLSNRQFLVAQIADAQAQAEACGYIFITFMIATWYKARKAGRKRRALAAKIGGKS